MTSRRIVKAPKYSLELIQRRVDEAFIGRAVWTRTVARTGLSERAALKFIRAGIRGLTRDCFCETVALRFQEGQVMADVYGWTDERFGDWYVKFHLSRTVVVLSFHEPEHELVRQDGRVIRPERK